MSLAVFFSAVVVAVLAFGAFMYLVSARKYRNVYEQLSRTTTFHCLKCDSVYVSRTAEKSKACPKCGYKNSEMKF